MLVLSLAGWPKPVKVFFSSCLFFFKRLLLTAQDVRMIFEMFDSNNDGTMDIAEFENITENLRQQSKQTAATRTGFKENAE